MRYSKIHQFFGKTENILFWDICEDQLKEGDVETKKVDILFGVVVIAFLAVTFILIKEINYRRTNDFKEYSDTLSYIVKQKNNKIKVLAHELLSEQKNNQDLKNTLEDTRNSLDALTKKLAQQASAPVAPTAPAGVTK